MLWHAVLSLGALLHAAGEESTRACEARDEPGSEADDAFDALLQTYSKVFVQRGRKAEPGFDGALNATLNATYSKVFVQSGPPTGRVHGMPDSDPTVKHLDSAEQTLLLGRNGYFLGASRDFSSPTYIF